MAHSVSIFSAESCAITFTDKKGDLHSMTPEGAIFKGGLALAAVQDHVIQSAFRKALNGNYWAAGDCTAAAFPAVFKMTEKFIEDNPRRTKSNFTTLVNKVLAVKPKEGKDYTAKQQHVRAMLNAWTSATMPAATNEVVEAA